MFPLREHTISGYSFNQPTWYNNAHCGVDYQAETGTEVFAPFNGEIVREWTGREGGKTLWFKPDHDDVIMRFMHLDHYEKPVGHVNEGDLIAVTDASGELTRGAHLHLDISRGEVVLPMPGNFIDPETYDWHETKPEAILSSGSVTVPVFTPFTENFQPSQEYRPGVVMVQKFLQRAGFMPEVSDDQLGYYGKKTQAAVNAYQKARGINALPQYYGWWFDKTRAAANDDLQQLHLI